MNIDLDSLRRLAFDALPVLLDAAVKGAVLLAVAGVLLLAMRKASAAARQVVWLLALAALIALPLASAALPSWGVLPGWAKIEMAAEPVSADVADSASAEAPAEPLRGADQADMQTAPPAPREYAAESGAPVAPIEAIEPGHQAAPTPAAAASMAKRAVGSSWRMWIIPSAVAIWVVGSLVCLLTLVLGRISLWRLARRSRRITGGSWASLSHRAAQAVGLRRPVTLLQSRDEPMPMVWGTLRPKLLLPTEAEDWTLERRWVVVLHELAHAKRRDCLAKLIAHVACALYWFNPLCWIAFKRMQREAEAACDDLVLNSTAAPAAGSIGVSTTSGPAFQPVRPSDYAQHLLEIASGLKSGMLAAYSSVAMARKVKLEGRLVAILDATRNRRALTRLGILIAGVLVAAVALPLAVVKAAGQDSSEVFSLVEQLASRDEHTWQAAAERLRKMGPAIAGPVSRLFAQGGPGDAHATQVLESMGKNADVQALMRKGLDSGNVNVVHCSLIVLGKSGNRAHVSAIAPLLEKNTIAASIALSELGGDEAFQALLAVLNKPNIEPRWLIAKHLAGFGRPEAIPQIKKALGSLTGKDVATAHRYVRAIHQLERNGSRPGRNSFSGFHAVGDRGWRLLEGISLDKMGKVYVQPFQPRATAEQTRAAAYQALTAKEGLDLAWDQSQGNRVLAVNGLRLAPYTPALPKGYDVWADGERFLDQRWLAKIVEIHNAKDDVSEVKEGVRAYPFKAGDYFLALLPDGRAGILRLGEVTTQAEHVRIPISLKVFDPLYKAIPASAFSAAASQASTQPVELHYRSSSTFSVADAGVTVIHVAANGNLRTGWTGPPKGEVEFAEFRLDVDANHRDHLKRPQGVLISKAGKCIPVVSLLRGDVAAWIREVSRDGKSQPRVGILLPDSNFATVEKVWRALPAEGRDRWILLVPGKVPDRPRLVKLVAEKKSAASKPTDQLTRLSREMLRHRLRTRVANLLRLNRPGERLADPSDVDKVLADTAADMPVGMRRLATARLLEWADQRKVLTRLAELTRDEDGFVTLHASQVLALSGRRGNVQLLRDIAGGKQVLSSSEFERDAAAWTLLALGETLPAAANNHSSFFDKTLEEIRARQQAGRRVPRDVLSRLAKQLQPASQPAGSRLEFRIAPKPSDLGKAELASYMDWLKASKVGFWWKNGRVAGIAGRMPDHAWLPISGELTNAPQLVTGLYQGQKYVLVSDKPGQTMVPGEGKDAWGLSTVFAGNDRQNEPAVKFVLDDRGAELFSALTRVNINNALAIVVDGKVISAPIIRTALGKQGQITGRFTEQEIQALVRSLKAGMPPAGKAATQSETRQAGLRSGDLSGTWAGEQDDVKATIEFYADDGAATWRIQDPTTTVLADLKLVDESGTGTVGLRFDYGTRATGRRGSAVIGRVESMASGGLALTILPAASQLTSDYPSTARILLRRIAPANWKSPATQATQPAAQSGRRGLSIRRGSGHGPGLTVDGPLVTVSNDGRLLVASIGRQCGIIDVATGRETRCIRAPNDGVWCISPDRKVLAGSRGTVMDAVTGRQIAELDGGDRGLSSMPQFSGDGGTLALFTNKFAAIYDARTWKLRRKFTSPAVTTPTRGDIVGGGTMSADGRMVAVWHAVPPSPGAPPWRGNNGAVTVFDVASGEEVLTAASEIPRPSKLAPGPLNPSLNANGKRLALNNMVVDVGSGRTVWQGDNRLTFAAISPDGRTVAACRFVDDPYGKGPVELYRVSDGKLIGVLQGVDPTLRSLEFSPKGSLLIGRGGTVREATFIWRVAAIQPRGTQSATQPGS